MVIDAGGKTGRRPGGSSSRDAILDAARTLFTLHGYKGATVRAIAGAAGADPALIRHFFGDKDGLFAAAMALPADATQEILDVFTAPDDQWGERLTWAYLGLWERPETAAPLRATLVSAFTNDQALDHFREFLVATMLEPASRKLPPGEPELRLTVAISHLIGVALSRHLLKAPPIERQSLANLVALVAPSIQGYLTGPLPIREGSLPAT
ncbi:hypothetical protein GCM10027413_10100 [Conyzicola nivalis]|uniref:HTH tetR-type domain-containing protein n=1 Tax=Conyzicola nivalis TaxID=1477021 RepID=A0A916SKY2_9MICO|nr:TetR family transcriptional regulator [Conyzicola nivalis]GGB02581.1 hypothetical protein GCM10010979_16520 [Conyzicola nivalis]